MLNWRGFPLLYRPPLGSVFRIPSGFLPSTTSSVLCKVTLTPSTQTSRHKRFESQTGTTPDTLASNTGDKSPPTTVFGYPNLSLELKSTRHFSELDPSTYTLTFGLLSKLNCLYLNCDDLLPHYLSKDHRTEGWRRKEPGVQSVRVRVTKVETLYRTPVAKGGRGSGGGVVPNRRSDVSGGWLEGRREYR